MSTMTAGQKLRAAEDRRQLMNALRARITDLAARQQLTEAQLARRCRLGRNTVLTRSEPRLSLILVICDGLGVTPTTLLKGLPLPRERQRL